MGLFTSKCKKCGADIDWFMDAPKHYHCDVCQAYNSPEEIELSWRKLYGEHIARLKNSNRKHS